MRIGIIGAGKIGGNLGRRWAALGHEVRFGARDPASLGELVAACGASGASGGRAAATYVRGAAEFAEVVVLAVPFAAVPEVLAQAGDLAGKVLVDATNAVAWTPTGPALAVATSAAEEVAARAPGARVVKAFNQLGAEHLLDPVVHGVPADTFICGDDAAARGVVRELAESLGFGVVDAGGLAKARLLESLAILWIHMATRGGLGRDIAFKLLRS